MRAETAAAIAFLALPHGGENPLQVTHLVGQFLPRVAAQRVSRGCHSTAARPAAVAAPMMAPCTHRKLATPHE